MARISLRDYNREVEEMVDGGRIEEAIAHCRYILEHYPKHVTTYHSLGKALLEAQRYGDAADVFLRVLSCIPDDFISHLGMSIIREDEGDLDGAIWHMERAFEVQPSNAAVQAELRRLYGRRDGTAPNKVQLTRGAMARMSAKSNLYTQAIAELRTALADDPNRPDLQVLLARMYLLAGQRLAAIEMCNALLSKYPYCLEANRLLAEILPGTERAAEAEQNRRRLEELDPYEAHISPAAPTADQVLAGAITLERLDFVATGAPAAAGGESHWASSLGVTLPEAEEAPESLPDWLTSPEESAIPAVEEEAETAGAGEEEIPEWMQAAGWQAASGAGEEGIPGFEATQATEAESGTAADAEIPDWLRELTPESEEESAREASPGAALAGAALAGAAAFAASQAEKGSEESEAAGLEVEPAETPAPMPAIAAGAIAAAAESGDLEELTSGEGGELQPAAPSEEAVEPGGEELPDWLMAEEEEPAITPAEAELPDWLTAPEEEMAGMGAGALAAASAGMLSSEREEELPATVPPSSVAEWLEESQVGTAAETDLESAGEQATTGGIPEWLAQISPEEPAYPAMSLQEDQTLEEGALAQAQIPDWLREMEEGMPEETQPGAPEVIGAAATVVEEAPSGELAGEDLPDWLKAAMAAEVVGELTERPAPAELLAEPPIIEGDTKPVRIRPVEPWPTAEAVPGEGTPPAEPAAAGEIPPEEEAFQPPRAETLAVGETWQPAEEEAPSEEAPIGTPADLEDEEAAMAWLEGLAARQGALEEELLTTPEERPGEAPDWVLQYDQEEAPQSEAEEKPDWLGAAAAAAVTAAVIKEHGEEPVEELAEEAAGEEAAESTTPTEWIPEEAPVEPEGGPPITEVAIAAALIEEKAGEPGIEESTEQEVELPEWLRGYEGEAAEPSVEAAALVFEEQAETLEAAGPEVVPEAGSPLDVNAASLAQLERVPGIGFILAQNIVSYREVNGPFHSLEELQNVSGVTPETAADLERWLTVAVVAEVAVPPTSDPELATAWQAISAGNIDSAVDQYTRLIRQERDLDEVIKEIQQALVVHPLDPLLYQTLGDAYMRADRLQEALEAYDRAEDLLK